MIPGFVLLAGLPMRRRLAAALALAGFAVASPVGLAVTGDGLSLEPAAAFASSGKGKDGQGGDEDKDEDKEKDKDADADDKDADKDDDKDKSGPGGGEDDDRDGNSGPGGGGGGGGDRDDDNDDNSGPAGGNGNTGGGTSGPGGGDRWDDGGGSGGSPGAAAVTGAEATRGGLVVTYRDGSREVLANGYYQLLDATGKVLERRRATGADLVRMRAHSDGRLAPNPVAGAPASAGHPVHIHIRGRDVTVTYDNGWVEAVVRGRYSLTDRYGHVVIMRWARAEDRARLMALAGR